MVAGDDVAVTVDPVRDSADHRDIAEVPLDSFDIALVCTPDGAKVPLLEYLLRAGKHVLVEKPLLADGDTFDRLESLAAASGAVCYTAYNHRFEPNLVRLREALAEGFVGDLYRLRLFYGNGTAADVRSSPWRDQGAGVLPDLGSHLLDLVVFLIGSVPDELRVWSAQHFENQAFDHVVCGTASAPLLELEMSLVSWRNHFVADVVGSRGSMRVESLCKWGPSTLSLRRRVLPSGRPEEEVVVVDQPDPTWEAEYDHFLALCAGRDAAPARDSDRLIASHLARLAAEAGAR